MYQTVSSLRAYIAYTDQHFSSGAQNRVLAYENKYSECMDAQLRFYNINEELSECLGECLSACVVSP